MNILEAGMISKVQAVESQYLHHDVDERFQLHKESNQQKNGHTNVNSPDLNSRIREDRKLSNIMAPPKEQK